MDEIRQAMIIKKGAENSSFVSFEIHLRKPIDDFTRSP